ncbi:glucosamine-6-phosphate deaminase [Phaeovulum sp.]|uniref:glucosamine-6-phosphate deaminase n=1 Tax=Phaeovulum sp. TaxID=2934796 RepID=UPI0039E42712
MKVLILETAAQAVARATGFVVTMVQQKPDAVLGLATGGTMLPLYDCLRARHLAEGVSFAGVSTFNLDEYIGLSPDHPCSYHHYMQKALFDHIDIDPARTHLPHGDSADPTAEAARYEALIAATGGIDLQLLGIGQNGHIGFNEPTSSLASRTRLKTLTEDTRRANQRYFDSFDDTPRYALTMGVATILESKSCLLLATGSAKADAVAAMVEGPVAAICPASALQLHRNVTVVLDQEAAAGLKLRTYYHHVHPKGDESAIG